MKILSNSPVRADKRGMLRRFLILPLLAVAVSAAGDQQQAPPVETNETAGVTRRPRVPTTRGLVGVSFVVHTSGTTEDFKGTQSLGYGLDELAVPASRTAIFYPALKDGKPVAERGYLDASFRMLDLAAG